MKKDIHILQWVLLGCMSLYTTTASANDMRVLSSNNKTLFIQQDDCVQAADGCLLQVSSSTTLPSPKYYTVKSLCPGYIEYEYKFPLLDQLADRKILGRQFCRGMVSISSMDLPFASKQGLHANDGRLILSDITQAMKSIIHYLEEQKKLAEKASASASDTQRANYNSEFQAVLNNINLISMETAYAGNVALLNGGNMTLSVNHDQKEFIIPLPNVIVGPGGLNIANLSLIQVDSAKAAVLALSNAIHYATSELEKTLNVQPALQEVIKQDEVITTVDLTSSKWVVRVEGGEAKK